MMATAAIRETTLRELVDTRSISSISAIGQEGGFTIAVHCGKTTRVLGSTRGGVRMFSNLTNLATFLKGLGVSGFVVDAQHYAPGRIRPPRPDRSEALKRTRTKPQQTELLG